MLRPAISSVASRRRGSNTVSAAPHQLTKAQLLAEAIAAAFVTSIVAPTADHASLVPNDSPCQSRARRPGSAHELLSQQLPASVLDDRNELFRNKSDHEWELS